MKMLAFAVVAVLCLLSANALAEPGDHPGFLHSTLLNGVKLDCRSGVLRLHQVQALNLPEVESDTYRPYDPDGGGKLWAILAKKDGAELSRWDFYAEHARDGAWLLSTGSVTDIATGESIPEHAYTPGPGSYELRFHLEDEPFYKFAFAIAKTEFDDADPRYYLKGDWSKLGYMLYDVERPDNQLIWKMWLRHNEPDWSLGVKVRLEVSRDSDGELICTSRKNKTWTLQPDWQRRDFDLIHPMQGTSGGAMFLAEELLARDGRYTLKAFVDEELYSVWKFAVADGAFELTGRSADDAEPTRAIGGGGTAWWYQAEGTE